MLLVLDTLCSLFRDALTKNPSPRQAQPLEQDSAGAFLPTSLWCSTNARHCCALVLALPHRRDQMRTAWGAAEICITKAMFCPSIGFSSCGCCPPPQPSPAPGTAGVQAHPRTRCISVTPTAKQAAERRVTIHARSLRHFPPARCVPADSEAVVCLSQISQCLAACWELPDVQRLTSPTERARALPQQPQSESGASSSTGLAAHVLSSPLKSA